MTSLTSGIKINPTSDFVKVLIDQITDEWYALSRKKIGGTVIINHLCKDRTDWQAIDSEVFTSPTIYSNQLYEPGVFEKFFKSKGPEHKGAVIINLRNGLIDSVSAKLFMVKHDCKEKCANRGTRHTSACSFSNFTTVPIIVISEEKGQVSLFWKGQGKFDIGKEDLKKDLLKAYETKEESYLACTTWNNKHSSKLFHQNAFISSNENGYQLFSDRFIKDVGYHKSTEDVIYLIHENPECQIRKLQNMLFRLYRSQLRLQKLAKDDEDTLRASILGIKTNPSHKSLSKRETDNSVSIVSSTTTLKTKLSNDKTYVQKCIRQLTDELYALARKKWWHKAIGGTVIINHLRQYTADWQATMQSFVATKPFNQPYQPSVFKKIFTSKGPEENFHDGAAIFYLHEGLIHTVSAKLPMTKHNCQQCADRGTRHASACYFSNFTSVPIIVISEEKGEVSMFWKGRAQFGIKKEDLKKELLTAYEKQEDSCAAYTTFTDQHFSKYFHLNPIIPNYNGDHKWFLEFSAQNLMELLKGSEIRIGKYSIHVTPENQEGFAMVEAWFKYGVQADIEAYNKKEEQCLILTHGDKPLGSIFYKIVGKTLILYQPFLLRQLLHNGFAGPFFEKCFGNGCIRIVIKSTSRYLKICRSRMLM